MFLGAVLSTPLGGNSMDRGSARIVIQEMLKHLCSAISYGGATSLDDLRRRFREHPEQYLVKLTAASRTESFQR